MTGIIHIPKCFFYVWMRHIIGGQAQIWSFIVWVKELRSSWSTRIILSDLDGGGVKEFNIIIIVWTWVNVNLTLFRWCKWFRLLQSMTTMDHLTRSSIEVNYSRGCTNQPAKAWNKAKAKPQSCSSLFRQYSSAAISIKIVHAQCYEAY